MVSISNENLPQGEEVPIPTMPAALDLVDTLKIGVLLVEVEILKALSVKLDTLCMVCPVLDTEKSVVVESPTVDEAIAKRVRLVEEAA